MSIALGEVFAGVFCVSQILSDHLINIHNQTDLGQTVAKFA